MKTYFFVIALTLSTYGQAFSYWGVDLGLNSANFQIDGVSGLGVRNNDNGYEIGARYDHLIFKKLGLTLGFGISQYASSYNGNDEGISPSSGNRISSIYKFSFLNFYLRPMAFYYLNEKLKILAGLTIEKPIRSMNDTTYSFQDASFQNQNQNFKYGEVFLRYSINVGISYDYKIKVFKKDIVLIPRFMLQHALSDSYDKNGFSIKGSSIHLSTGIKF